jgi:hypothetical protein
VVLKAFSYQCRANMPSGRFYSWEITANSCGHGMCDGLFEGVRTSACKEWEGSGVLKQCVGLALHVVRL